MKRKYVVLLIVIILLALLIPIPKYLNDGGTVEYKSLIYKISVVHRSNEYSETKYDKVNEEFNYFKKNKFY